MKINIALFFALAASSFAAAPKTFDIAFPGPETVGTLQVEPGQYKLSVDGTKVTLVSAKSHQILATEATIETLAKKADRTSVQTKNVDGKNTVTQIQLAGTTTSLVFKK